MYNRRFFFINRSYLLSYIFDYILVPPLESNDETASTPTNVAQTDNQEINKTNGDSVEDTVEENKPANQESHEETAVPTEV